MNARSMTSKLKRFGEGWTVMSSPSAPVYGVIARETDRLDLPTDSAVQAGSVIQRNVDGSAWLCRDICNHGGLYLSAEVQKCSHFSTVYRQAPASKDTFGRDTAVELVPILENIPLHLVSRTMSPDMGKDRSKLTWQATFETSAVYDIHPADELHTVTSEFRVLGAVELTPGVLTISAISI